MNEERPQLEYNLAGGLLLTIREQDFQSLVEGVASSGYNHACLMPFRALRNRWSLEKLSNSPLTVIHLEDAWNPTPYDFLPMAVISGLWGFLRRKMDKQARPSTIADSFFPGEATCENLLKTLMASFPQAKLISHQVNMEVPKGRLLLEINEGLNLSAQEILELSQKDEVGLVFDPSHLLPSEKTVSFAGEPTRKPRGEWERQFLTFASRLEVVDINSPRPSDIRFPERTAIDELLKGRGTLAELAKAAKELPGVKFLRVEIPLPLANQIPMLPTQRREGFEFLKQIGEALKSV